MVLNPKLGYQSSTPEQQAEEFFRLVVGPAKHSHTYKVKTKGSGAIETSPSAFSMDQYLTALPKSESISSNIENGEGPLSGSFPSPPSAFNLSKESNMEESMSQADKEPIENQETKKEEKLLDPANSGKEQQTHPTSVDEVELYQSSGPIEFNKILDDIPEEDEELERSTNSMSRPVLMKEAVIEESDSLDNSISSGYRSVIRRVAAIEESVEDGSISDQRLAGTSVNGQIFESSNTVGSKPAVSKLPASKSSTSVDSIALDFDKLLEELKESDLLEITQAKRKQSLSRQSSFAGPPPSLPATLPPGPTLSPYDNTGSMDGDFDTIEFMNALKRLSFTSLDNAALPDLPLSNPPGKLLSPRQSFSELKQNGLPHEYRLQKSLSLPPPLLERQENEEDDTFQRHPSFLRHHYHPPQEFSSDSGVTNTTDTEAFSQDDLHTVNRQSKLLQALRAVDLDNKTKSSSPSSSQVSSELNMFEILVYTLYSFFNF